MSNVYPTFPVVAKRFAAELVELKVTSIGFLRIGGIFIGNISTAAR